MSQYVRNGKVVTREEFDATARQWPEPGKRVVKRTGFPATPNTYSEGKPLVSDGLGCLKAQVPEMRKAIHEEGIAGAAVRDNGQIEFTSRGARAKMARMRGLCDNDGGYGDG